MPATLLVSATAEEVLQHKSCVLSFMLVYRETTWVTQPGRKKRCDELKFSCHSEDLSV